MFQFRNAFRMMLVVLGFNAETLALFDVGQGSREHVASSMVRSSSTESGWRQGLQLLQNLGACWQALATIFQGHA